MFRLDSLRYFQKQTFRFFSGSSVNASDSQIFRKLSKEFQTLIGNYKDKIIFNSYIEREKIKLGSFKHYLKTTRENKYGLKREYQIKNITPLPVCLKYYVDEERLLKEDDEEVTEPEKIFQLPFANTCNINTNDNETNTTDIISESEFDRSNINKWMTNYEYFDDSKLDESDSDLENKWNKQYGTPNSTIEISKVGCGGCGALLHCCDPAIPGYLPSEIFLTRTENELKTMECQRCHFLKEYNIALDVNVSADEYEKLLQAIRHIKSLVLVMIDLLDFPCSIWPGIVDIIGTKRPIFIIGNKVDLLQGYGENYLSSVKESLMSEINKTKLGTANIKHVALISAKTGYGIEKLITELFNFWLTKGDVFLIGSTNVGKSSLFNALLQSDYCKVHAIDILKRATVSRWPGTTLNLLKFPINRPSAWKIHLRYDRLKSEKNFLATQDAIKKYQIESKKKKEIPALIGHIGRSFSLPHKSSESIASKPNLLVLNERAPVFSKSKWFYDTPGVVLPDNALSLLTTEELLLTMPKQYIRPQTYYMYRDTTAFIAGFARIDYIEGENPCWFSIFCAPNLPITITKTEHADEVYQTFLGTELFNVPSRGVERLENWPGLRCREDELKFHGEGIKKCCGDIVLSSLAWVAITAKVGDICKFRAWTPEARGIHKRFPSVLPFSIRLKGSRIRNTPTYMLGRPINFKDS